MLLSSCVPFREAGRGTCVSGDAGRDLPLRLRSGQARRLRFAQKRHRFTGAGRTEWSAARTFHSLTGSHSHGFTGILLIALEVLPFEADVSESTDSQIHGRSSGVSGGPGSRG